MRMSLGLTFGAILLGMTGCRTSSTPSGIPAPGRPEGSKWEIGKPIVWYKQGPGAGGVPSMWNGPARPELHVTEPGEEPPRFEFISPAAAKKLADGGFNVMFVRNLNDLDWAHANGMRGLLYVHEGEPPWRNVFDVDGLDDPEWVAKLNSLIDSVKDHPAMYGYISYDEPGTPKFPELARIVAHVRKRDPKHMVFINLFPTYASPGAQGTSGDKVTAYREYLRRFIDEVKPDLLSYDHYHFFANSDRSDGYFLNLSLVREAALKNGLPFINVVQAASMGQWHRAPNGDEGRFLAYTTLAYDGQGICQFVYNSWEGAEHWGGIENPDRSLTHLGKAAREFQPKFVAIGEQLQPLTSLGVYHHGAVPAGGIGLPVDAPISVETDSDMLLGYFGTAGVTSHVLVVNLDYTQNVTTTVVGPGSMEVFDATERKWHKASDGSRARVSLMPGGGKLLRLAGVQE